MGQNIFSSLQGLVDTEEERDVQYASLDLKKTPKSKKKKKVIQNDVTYAAVKR
ncbi:UNVERIFIED_CONTAM: hypothetical protein FKN15_059935 [Acipenser sinensis]